MKARIVERVLGYGLRMVLLNILSDQQSPYNLNVDVNASVRLSCKAVNASELDNDIDDSNSPLLLLILFIIRLFVLFELEFIRVALLTLIDEPPVAFYLYFLNLKNYWNSKSVPIQNMII